MWDASVNFAHTRDGVTIAYGGKGQGPTLIFLTAWVSHLENQDDLADPASRFLDALSSNGRRRLVRFDWRGMGLSDRNVDDLSIQARIADLEAVVDALGVESVAIFAWSLSGPPAIVYSAPH